MHENEITPAALGSFLPGERLSRVHVFPEVDSTNTVLKRMAAEDAPAGTTVIADTQTAGRGRMDRRFESPAGAGLYLSYLLRPTAASEQLPELTAWTAVAVREAVADTAGVLPQIKWVNDLVFAGKKIAGILTETVLEPGKPPAVVVGIGINVSESYFSPEVAKMASSIGALIGSVPPRAALAAAVIRHMDRLALDFPTQKQRYLDAYRANCLTVGEQVFVTRGETSYHATAVAVADDFSLLVRREDGRGEAVAAGEVSVRGLYGYV